MKKFLGLLAIAALTQLTLSGCTSSPQVRAISDSSVDFKQYQTFGFANPLGTDKNLYRSSLSQTLVKATRAELEARGLRYEATNPQLLVNFNARLSEKYRVTSEPVSTIGYGRGYYGYRGSLYSPWPTYVDQTTVTPYNEGTLNIDVADTARKQLVWEGVVTRAISQKALNNLEKTVSQAIASAMEKFPIQR